tara:strand:+ start:433 stop:831 length:399 start_codon:yes stop_codon:yes gene_type:complete
MDTQNRLAWIKMQQLKGDGYDINEIFRTMQKEDGYTWPEVARIWRKEGKLEAARDRRKQRKELEARRKELAYVDEFMGGMNRWMHQVLAEAGYKGKSRQKPKPARLSPTTKANFDALGRAMGKQMGKDLRRT